MNSPSNIWSKQWETFVVEINYDRLEEPQLLVDKTLILIIFWQYTPYFDQQNQPQFLQIILQPYLKEPAGLQGGCNEGKKISPSLSLSPKS